MNKETPKTCFVSASAGTDLRVLRSELEARGLRVLVPHDLAIGTDWASEIQKQISQADLVVGVLTAERQSPWVLFELGQASALGRRIVLITPLTADPIPFSLHQFLVLRIDLDNSDAISFALDQILSAPGHVNKDAAKQPEVFTGLGGSVDYLLARLDQSLQSQDWQGVEQVVGDALRSSGADVVVTSPSPDIGADFAVWSDVLDSFVGNPLLVEVKARIRGRAEASKAIEQLVSYMTASAARWALLIVGEGPDPSTDVWSDCPPNVIVLSLEAMLESLRTRAFPEVVRDLRNQRVHGSSS